MMRKLNVFGNPYIGVFCRANESLACVPPQMDGELKNAVAEVLDADLVEMTVDLSILIGSFIAMNSRCAVVANMVADSEVKALEKKMKVIRLPHRLNAAGNNVLVNDNGALLNPGLDQRSADLIAREMDVTVMRAPIANTMTVGSAGVVTNKGMLCHPRATEDERARLSKLFGVPVQIATANYGTALVGACMAANSKGCVVGSTSTPIELGRIEDGLYL
jgi:translation initiation factor 6